LVSVDVTMAESHREGLIPGGTKFVAPDDDQKQLARQHPAEMAVVLLAGVCAEEHLLGCHLKDGWLGDIEIVKEGHGWTDAGNGERQERIRDYLEAADDAVQQRAGAIRLVASALLEAGRLTGPEVVALTEAPS
jgi:hypothetical protein